MVAASKRNELGDCVEAGEVQLMPNMAVKRVSGIAFAAGSRERQGSTY